MSETAHRLRVDHIVFGAADLESGNDEIERLLGVRPVPGGKHFGRGTHNALLGLGGGAYLEVLAPDPEQDPADELPFGMVHGMAPRVVAWAVGTRDIDAAIATARADGYDPGDAWDLSRRTPDGTVLSWRLTPSVHPGKSLAEPFLIDWGAAAHPSTTIPGGPELRSVVIEHPDPAGVSARLAALAAPASVVEAPHIAIVATVETSHGVVELR